MFEQALLSLDRDQINADLKSQGYHKLNVRLSTKALADSIRQIDDICANSTDLEVNYGGSEHRIWHASQFMDAAEEFRKFSNSVIPKLDNRIGDAYTILGIRNKPLTNEQPSLRKSRWHLDSFRKQLKIFVFLNEVSENDGPFELIPQTQKMRIKIKHAFQTKYFRAKDFAYRTGKRGYDQIDESFIQYVENTYPPKLFTVPAGTILIADTSAIHRAHPVNGGERYAFTSYHR